MRGVNERIWKVVKGKGVIRKKGEVLGGGGNVEKLKIGVH